MRWPAGGPVGRPARPCWSRFGTGKGMNNKRLGTAIISCLILLTACTHRVVSAPPTAPAAPAVSFAPYVDATGNDSGIGPALTNKIANRFVFSFLLARGSACDPGWGDKAVDDPGVLADAAKARAAGGEV